MIIMTLFVQNLDLKHFFSYFLFIATYAVTGLLLHVNYRVFRIPGEIVAATCLYLVLSVKFIPA